jgi:hypothetical protein
LNHEDITVGTFPDTGLNRTDFQDHGTAVLGTIMMLDNKLGGIGMTPNVNGYVVSQWRPDGSFNTADAIMTAINHLKYWRYSFVANTAFDPAGSDLHGLSKYKTHFSKLLRWQPPWYCCY